MRQPPGRRVPLGPEEDDEDEEEMTTLITPGQMNSTNPADMALAATDAAWRAYRASLIDRGALAGRWSNVAQAMARVVDAVCQTEDRYAVKEDGDINPHQRIGVLSDDEIETVMALRRGTAVVTPRGRSEVMHPAMAARAVDPLGIGTRIHEDVLAAVDGDNHTGRLMWCLLSLLGDFQGGDYAVIPQDLWDKSGGGQVTVTMRVDGGRTVRRS